MSEASAAVQKIHWPYQALSLEIILTRSMGLPEAVIARYIDNRPASPILPITSVILAAQQATADLFYENRLLPKHIDVSAVIWK